MALLAIVFLSLITLAYFAYGKKLSRFMGLNAHSTTPAHKQRDDIDFVPVPAFMLFGQHFSAIAAAGPVAGPIIAALGFGWLPALLWIGIGVVFIGAVHDFMTLMISVRNQGRSIADLATEYLGLIPGRLMMTFIWIALLYIIVAFTDITSASFVTSPEELAGVAADFHRGGAVAAASIGYLALSMILGIVQRFLAPSSILQTLIFVPLVIANCAFAPAVSQYFVWDATSWSLFILAYCLIGSVAPVWLLLQPRGFLGGYVLYFALIVGLVGVFFGPQEILAPAITAKSATSLFSFDGTQSIFPFLFVTIACGACSGFHGLVCSGTTSKQLSKETHAHAIAYGAMLAEAMVAFLALSIVMTTPAAELAGLKPGTIYGNGIGRTLTMMFGSEYGPIAVTMGAMAFSTFVFDTLDVSARLGRHLFQELLHIRNQVTAVLGGALTVGIPAIVIVNTPEGSWIKYWTLFGASNQLLAALSLAIVAVWLHEQRKKMIVVVLPLVFMVIMTQTALVSMFFQSVFKLDSISNIVNAVSALALVVLSIFVLQAALKKITRKAKTLS